MFSGSKHPQGDFAASRAEDSIASKDIQGLVGEFLDAHATAVKLQPHGDELLSSQSLDLLNGAKRRRADALFGLSNCCSACVADVRAKLDVLCVMADWFSDEDPRTTNFALLILREAIPFLADDHDYEIDRPDDLPEGAKARTGWFFSRFLKS